MTEHALQPSSESAERAVLGCVFLDNVTFNIVAEKLRYDDFYVPKNQAIFTAMATLSAQAEPIDYQTIEEALRQAGMLEKIGGMAYVTGLMDEVFYVANLESYIEIVKEKAVLRALLRLGNDVSARSIGGTESAAAILDHLESSVLKIGQERLNEGLVPLRETLEETLTRISELSRSQGQLTGLTTGFTDLDKQLSGLQKSDLILLAARPSMGKTALGVNIGLNAARKKDALGEYSNKVAIFSLEMSRYQLNQRMLSMTSGINLQDIISGNIEGKWEELLAGIDLLKKLPIFIDDTSAISIQELRSKCRRLQMEGGLDLVVIDYLQLMTVEDVRRAENRQQEISAISRGLKALAKELDCPVLALSQLSRKAESREKARPQMSDMRESGAIEQDADVVMLLYREDYYNRETEHPNVTDVIIAKHRNGPTGVVQLYFTKELTKFGNINYVDS
uniref:replicative DNA helicase n=1 Tax=Ndongobacter massiliensis TaxID=1871025 RepID=UPI0009317DA4|nr:replicative DNA helicase [Ndongobacter massiliensis]